MAGPKIITMLTDFGTRDAYVGIVKGVIATRCPEARTIDLTHEIAAGNIAGGAYVLGTAWRYFPGGTVHLAVVDPGVGGPRKALAAEAGGHRFVAPDNGILSEVFGEAPPDRVVSVENEGLFLKPVSATFHGRDIFAGAAAALAAGAALESLGPALDRWTELPGDEPWHGPDGALIAGVVHVDHFGNLITNVRGSALRSDAAVRIAGRLVPELSTTYGSVRKGEFVALIGSGGRLEIGVNCGNAAAALGVGPGAQLAVLQPGGGS